MTGNEYQELAMRTNDGKGMDRLRDYAEKSGNATMRFGH